MIATDINELTYLLLCREMADTAKKAAPAKAAPAPAAEPKKASKDKKKGAEVKSDKPSVKRRPLARHGRLYAKVRQPQRVKLQ